MIRLPRVVTGEIPLRGVNLFASGTRDVVRLNE